MVILGIETSCDETAASVVKDGRKILSNVIASSQEMHIKTGGIIPEQAAREQVKSIIPVIEESITPLRQGYAGQAGIKSIDVIAVTVGPGLIGSLLVGVETAKTLAWVWNKPIVPVNHLVGHIYANWLFPQEPSGLIAKQSSDISNLRFAIAQQPSFPAVALVVSGGHTDLVLMKDHGKIEWIGGTRDDAAGEAFDKTARLLGLGYPGGPSVAAAAAKMENGKWKMENGLPRPLMDDKTFDFSFSGLKTAVLREVQSDPTSLKLRRAELASQVQEAITDVLVAKTLRAVKEYNVSTLLLAGGVAANQRLREKFREAIGPLGSSAPRLHVPEPKLCTDNASFIASFAEFNFHPVPWQKITTHPSLAIT